MTTLNAITSPIPSVSIVDNHAVTSSLAVAEYFGKRHDDVLKKVRCLMSDLPESERVRNFTETFQTVAMPNNATKQTPVFEMTKDGFTLLVMGFTGKEALAFKVAYINRFNEMETALKTSPPTFDLADLLSQTINQISKGNKKLYKSMYNGLMRRFKANGLADIPHAEIHNALATIYFFAVEWHRKNTPTQLPLKLNDGEHYLVVKDGVVLWERKLKPNCNDIPANTLQNPKLMLEHMREVVGEFVGKEALPAPKPILDINYPAITARPRNSFLPNQHWFQAKDFVNGNFDPVRDFLDKLEQDGYEVTGLKIINNAKTFIIQQQDKAIKHIEKGYKVLVEGVNICNEKGLYVSGFTMGKVSY